MENHSPRIEPGIEGNTHVFQLIILREGGVTKFHVRWHQPERTDQQEFDVAMLVDRIMRTESSRFNAACATIDEDARVGRRVREYPLLGNLISQTIFVREADDISEIAGPRAE